MKGSSTVEACLIFPVIFLLTLLFLQYAMYFVALEYAEGLCEEALIAMRQTEADSDTLESCLEEKAEQGGLFSEGTEISISTQGAGVFEKVTVTFSGAYTLLYDMEVVIEASGFHTDAYGFCQITDFVWDSVSKASAVQSFLKQWFGDA